MGSHFFTDGHFLASPSSFSHGALEEQRGGELSGVSFRKGPNPTVGSTLMS